MEFRIKEILKERGITALTLAKGIEMTQANLSNIMTGKTKPSLDTLEKIASALNVPITDLFERSKQNTITCPKCGTALEIKEKESYNVDEDPLTK
ncbi:helix-turn-helix domain-containing protein [Dysgonomonas macrotermitis]|uniref:DNA-binding transcriptional regulator, XRE-family HTH domain n=1 Tax=Dysgonomonas macrotermitis TaxID=1346286 RepID=A0A1M5GLI8_9BACT|nr:helix-turn-helix transcriptional regulator [Dysgonomonas macrotermitis]SHG04553.1 DNA-binding transcriptional regulator, XRE-family HTH domain [Dysgonomonas macrotermitis]